MKKTLMMTMIITLVLVSSTIIEGGNKKPADTILERIGISRGICVVLGDTRCELALELAAKTELLIYVQLQKSEDVERARKLVDAAGFYGTRIYVEKGALTKLYLADNIVDVLIAVGEKTTIAEAEVLRVLRPRAKALLGAKELVKPVPEGLDDWSHPYHGPDNNPQSKDQVARAPYLTQFLAEPYYAPMTQAAVASAGRAFKAFGHLAFHEREEPFLNKLVAFNGYNGTILWMRDLVPGIMVHRNTLIATPTTVYVGDNKSCKVIDAATGRLKDEICPPAERAGGTFWKWMGLEGGILYALIGEQEPIDPVERHRRIVHGWPWHKISRGFNQDEHPWGFGRNVLAIDTKTKKVLWSYREDEPVDTRAMCMKNGRIYIFRFGSFLTCLNAKTGQLLWRKTPDNAPELFESLGTYLTRQSWRTNWRTAAYLKCSDKALYFAGPQVGKLLAVSAEDGGILWENPYDNFQLILRDDGLYGISGPWGTNVSKKFNPLTGEVLAELKVGRRACTRPTASLDAIFYRAQGGTVRLDLASGKPHWISPMRPPCHDGVTIANGLLYWWPSICDCQLSIYGVTCLGPAGNFNFSPQATEAERLEKYTSDPANVVTVPDSPADWPSFRKDSSCSATSKVLIADDISLLWRFNSGTTGTSATTAPVAAGGLVFVSGNNGIVNAIETKSGKLKWKAFTAGSVRLPPTIWKGRALVGSGDGWVYNFEAQTGRLLWRFRAAPTERRIPVYGTLSSTWPAASGVVVKDGIAYVAAGIVNYDGTYVYALDAATGRMKWQNNTSGHLYSEARTGVSVHGHLLIHNDKLYLAGGSSVSPAIYDIENGKCLNNAEQLKRCESRSLRGWELCLLGDRVFAFGQPFYGDPEWPVYDASVFNNLAMASLGEQNIVWMGAQKAMKVGRVDEINKPALVRQLTKQNIFKYKLPEIAAETVWEHDCKDVAAMAVCSNAVVLAKKTEIVALDVENGKLLWSKPLSSPPVRWGLAVDRDGRIILTLKDGQVLCFG